MLESTNFNGLATASRSEIINLFNYIDALQEYFEERLSDASTELQTVKSLREDLKNVLAGKPATGTENTRILLESYEVFGPAGLMSIDDALPSHQQELSVPAWCIQKVYEGMAKLGRASS
jgi:hypothetical protein